MLWWNRKSRAPQEEESSTSSSMERADAALDEVHENRLKTRGVLYFLKREAEDNHFALDFIKMVERGRPS